MARFLPAALVAAALLVPNAAAAPHVDVVVDAGTATLTAEKDGTHTAAVTLSNLLTQSVLLQAAVLAQPDCTVDASPASLAPGLRTKVTLTLHRNCDVGTSPKISLGFGAAPTASSPAVATEPATSVPNWHIVAWSFGIAVGVAFLIALADSLVARRYNRLKPPRTGATGAPAVTVKPDAQAKETGPIPDGTFVYAITELRHGVTRSWPFWKTESALGPHSSPVPLTEASQIEVGLAKSADKSVVSRRLYRRRVDLPEFRRVAEVAGHGTQTVIDGWTPIRPWTELTGLGTDWSFKDNWVGSITVVSAALLTLFAGTDTLGAVVSESPAGKPTLTAMAVAAAVGAVFVALGPLIIKLVGPNLNVPTAAGAVVASFVTLVGAVGQTTALTWYGYELVAGYVWYVRLGVVAVGGIAGVAIIWYAGQALWFYLRTGAQFTPAKQSEAMKAAMTLVEALKTQAQVSGHATKPFDDLLKSKPASAAPQRQQNALL